MSNIIKTYEEFSAGPSSNGFTDVSKGSIIIYNGKEYIVDSNNGESITMHNEIDADDKQIINKRIYDSKCKLKDI